MKKFLYILTFALAALTLSCSKVDDAAQQEGKGAVSFSVTRGATGAEDVLQLMKFRVYSVDAQGEKTLIRLYSYDEVKDMKMWLVAGP